MTLVADAAARERAIDPGICCCVTAPAGSGKTELLIQRSLALLARVSEPEQVVAITFTRKAAAEMRARLLSALHDAAAGVPVASAHLSTTRTLAEAVLTRDREQSWGLLATPARLRILTIDSFCGELTRQMPLLSGCGGALSRIDDAEHLYREAVNDLLTDLAGEDGEMGQALQRVLLHLDNNWDTATTLLTALLSRRDQWLPLFGGRGLTSSPQQELQAVLDRLWEDLVHRLGRTLVPWQDTLTPLLSYRAEVLNLPADDARAEASQLADALLTKAGGWRARITKNEGFPTGDAAAKAQKASMTALLDALREDEAKDEQGAAASLRAVLLRVRDMPDPENDPGHWEVLVALTRILPRLAAQLLVVFRRAGEVDHAQIALAALEALGEEDTPSELALRLDHRLEHLLVDEFQDTSSGQFELIRRLTRGWNEHNEANPGAPRTLMLVGDGMQSIYGFRDANVGLFIRAREEGVGDLLLEPLSLTVNFRSCGAIVDWINRTFPRVLPATDDAQMSAVRYRAAEPRDSDGDQPVVKLFSTPDASDADDAEYRWICDQLKTGIARDDVSSIAILGRSRNLLRPLLARLRQAGIEYRARDLDPLQQRMPISDLMVLCRVLADPHDRFAWLCLLRTPWIGLDHGDLLAASRGLAVAASLLHGQSLPDGISDAARHRLEALQRVLRWAEHYRDRVALRVWVEECWLQLGGAVALENDAQRQDVEEFFRSVEQLEQEGDGLQPERLEERISRLYAAPGHPGAKVEVMTLHKAKGLEFDWVFVPSIQGGTRGGGGDLLLWDEFTDGEGNPEFLFDLRAARDAEQGQRIYDLLRRRGRDKQALELGRLLYVGCTRAAQRLFLSGCAEWDEERGAVKAPAGSFLEALLPGLEMHPVPTIVPETQLASGEGTVVYRRIQRLPPLTPLDPERSYAAGTAVDMADNRLDRAFGTALHRSMESLLHRAALPTAVDAQLTEYLSAALLEAGCDRALLAEYQARGLAMLETALADPKLQWMLSAERLERAVELPLTVVEDGEFRQLVVDYSFVDKSSGERWIVDYKSSSPKAGEDSDVFFDLEAERYREQLSRYRQAFAAMFPEQLRCALYFLSAAEWREVSFSD